jgi:hypothetical protein
VAALALLLSGCVYLRLLELKHQLGQFDRYFGLQTDDGLTLIFQSPVLLSNDLRWIGLKPEEARKLGLAEWWRARWVKQLPPGVTETPSFDIVLELGFADDKLTRVAIPERYFAQMPKEFVIGVIRSLGRGAIDRSSKRIDATVSGAAMAAVRPNLPAIDRLLGRPTGERTDGPLTVVSYRYVPVTTEAATGVFEMHLTFETSSGELRKWQGVTRVGRIGFDFAPGKGP